MFILCNCQPSRYFRQPLRLKLTEAGMQLGSLNVGSGATLAQVRLPGAARDSLLKSTLKHTLLWCSYSPSSQPLVIACIKIGAHVRNPTPNLQQPYHCLDTQKYCAQRGQPSKTECGCPNGGGTGNGYTRISSTEKRVYFLRKNRKAEKELSRRVG